MIVLMVVGLMVLIGIGHTAMEDFGVPKIVPVLLCGLIVGLMFVPKISIGSVSFSVGTVVFFATVLLFWAFRGSLKNKLVCLLYVIGVSAALYGFTWLLGYLNVTNAPIGVYHALAVGFVSFLLTRNTKYGFIVASVSIGVVGALYFVGGKIDLDALFSPAVVAGTTASVLYALVRAALPKRASKPAYYLETGRLVD